jgi:RNA polymerase sigma-70 factor (ECF subfamily)
MYYNNDHAETRRHCSLESYNLDNALLPSDEDIENKVLENEENARFYEAIRTLSESQQDLIEQVFIKGISVNEYARQNGVDHSAISHRIQVIRRELKKFLK